MSINLYLGPMWSGKSSKLISEYLKWKCINKPTLVINNKIDNRYGEDEYLYSHDHVKIACLPVLKLNDVSQDLIDDSDAIFIDEAQFFPDLKEKVLEWCEQYNKHIYISGLDGDRKREKFGQVIDLIPYADDYQKFKAKCKICLDGTNAIFTFDQQLLSNDLQIKVGTDNYLPLCRNHYITLTESVKDNNPSYDQ